MKFIIVVIFLVLNSSANEGHVLASIDVQNDNEIILSGTTVYKEKYNRNFIAKADSSLKIKEIVELPQKRDIEAKGLIKDVNQNLIVLSTAYNDNNTTTNIRLTKRDVNNGVLWDNIYTNDNNLTLESHYRTPIVQANDGSLLVLSSYQTPSRKKDILLYKIDNNGTKLWEKSFGTVEDDILAQLIINRDKTYSLFYMTEMKTENIDVYILTIEKINKNGKQLYSKRYFRTQQDKNINLVLPGVLHTIDGGYILFGTARRITELEDSSTKYILKIDAKGNTIWEKSIKDDAPFSKLVYLFRTDSNYVSFAMSYNSINEPYVSAVMFDGTGTVSKLEHYKKPKIILMGAIPSKDNGFIIIGGRQNDKNKTETFVFKIDDKLHIVWKKQLRTVPFIFGLPLLKERPDGKVVVGYTYKKDENSKFQIGLKLLDSNGTVVHTSDI